MLTFDRRPTPAPWPVSVTVSTCARLHVGFMDLNFALGRRFGSVGFAIDAPRTRITARLAQMRSVEGPQAERIGSIIDTMSTRLGLASGVNVMAHEAIDAHAGLGSGTQLALATGTALARLAGSDISAHSIAALLGRGGRSGIGIGTFERGGIVLDAGKDKNMGDPPPIVWRHDMPAEWRIVLLFDRARTGVHGAAETAAFGKAEAMAPEVCGEICRLTLMQLIPSVIERNIQGFGAAVTLIQERIGDYFAPWQGGQRFASPAVSDALDWLAANGAAGVGQSSWGPTGYAIAENEAQADRLAAAMRHKLGGRSGLEVRVCAPANHGASIVETPVLSHAML